MPTKNLEEHLGAYGIRRFSSDQYWEWAGGQLGKERALKIDLLRDDVTRPGARNHPDQVRLFYDQIAYPDVAPVIQSMKADAIRASGEAVSRKIAGRKNILDLGCGIGCLSAWYAVSDAGCHVTGVDFSGNCIAEAQRMAVLQRIENITFLALDICGSAQNFQDSSGAFDAVVDTQTLQMTRDLPRTLENVKFWLKPGGILVSVPVLETARHAHALIRCLKRAGFRLRSFEFIEYSDCGSRGAYPVLTAALEGKSITVDWEGEYDRMWRGCIVSKFEGTGGGSGFFLNIIGGFIAASCVWLFVLTWSLS